MNIEKTSRKAYYSKHAMSLISSKVAIASHREQFILMT